MDSKFLTKTNEKSTTKLKPPEDFKVVLLNDDFTTMDFVVEVLMVIFHKKLEDADKIMMDVHLKGKGVVGHYPWDIAATKVEQVHIAARESEFPLRCVLEPA